MAEKPDVLMIDLLKGIDQKLSLILGRMIKSNKTDIVIKDEIKELYQSGLDAKTIAQILCIPKDHASQEISRLKKNPSKEKKDGKKNLKITGK